jgi:hypothetical protein
MTEYNIPISTSWSEPFSKPYGWENYEDTMDSSTLTWDFAVWSEV